MAQMINTTREMVIMVETRIKIICLEMKEMIFLFDLIKRFNLGSFMTTKLYYFKGFYYLKIANDFLKNYNSRYA